jgi:N-ethylmaleimide reductase
VRDHYQGNILTVGGYTCKTACAAVQAGAADLVAFGKAYIANPDLAERLRLHAKLNEPDRETFYASDENGYTDYPFLEEAGT